VAAFEKFFHLPWLRLGFLLTLAIHPTLRVWIL